MVLKVLIIQSVQKIKVSVSDLDFVYTEKMYEIANEKTSDFLGRRCDVSFVIPVYNAERNLDRCLESIFSQISNYTYEVICVDDGSIDKSVQIMNGYAVNENFVLIHQENSGVSAARNTGLCMAHGTYVCFVDSDDYLSENFLQYMMECMVQTNADIVKGQYSIINESGISIKNALNNENYLLNGFCWGTLYKREIWDELLFPVGYWYEDMIIRMLVFRLAKNTAFCDSAIYIKNDNQNSLGKIQTRNYSCDFNCLDHIFLLSKCIDISEKYGLSRNEYSDTILIDELGSIMYGRMEGIPKNVLYAAFEMGCDLYEKYSTKQTAFGNKGDMQLHNALLTRNFFMWKYLCKAERFKN